MVGEPTGVPAETPFTEIVVPLDGSPTGEWGLAPALALVRPTRVPLRVLRRAFSDETAAVTDYLAEVAGSHADVADIGTVVVDRESIPDAVLDGLAPGSLVCASSHGRGGPSRAASEASRRHSCECSIGRRSSSVPGWAT